MTAAKTNGTRGSGREQTALDKSELGEVEEMLKHFRHLLDLHAAAREVQMIARAGPGLHTDVYRLPASLRYERLLLDLARGRAGDSVARLARRVSPFSAHKPYPAFNDDSRNQTIAAAVENVVRQMRGEDAREDAESWTLEVRECVDPGSLPRVTADEKLEPFPEGAITPADRPLVRAWERKWAREAQLEKQRRKWWSGEYQKALDSSEVREARSGQRGRRAGLKNAAYELVAELSGGSARTSLSAERVKQIVTDVEAEAQVRRKRERERVAAQVERAAEAQRSRGRAEKGRSPSGRRKRESVG